MPCVVAVFLVNSIFCREWVLKVSSGRNPGHEKENSTYLAMLTLLQDLQYCVQL